MNVVVSSQTDCKKTILSRGPAVGEELVFDERLRLRSAFPYAFQRKFDGRNYDIEEIQIRDGTDYRQAAIDIARGFNAHEKSKPVPGPVRRMMVDVPPGEIADRITVLEVKLEKLPPQQQLLVLKELSILRATFESFANGIDAALEDKIKLLRDLNREGWDQNEIIYRIFDDPRIGAVGWSLDPNNMEAVGTATVVTRAFRASQAANRRRISVKNDINRMLKCTWLEQKSFES